MAAVCKAICEELGTHWNRDVATIGLPLTTPIRSMNHGEVEAATRAVHAAFGLGKEKERTGA